MVKEGSYFSDREMKRRNPFHYHQFIFRHLTEDERIAAYKDQNKDDRFSAFLIGQFERNVENSLFEKQKEEDEAIIEEEDDDSEDETELQEESLPQSVTPIEKTRLRNEFTNLMYESFLLGKDLEFDYSSVDNNAEYDPPEADLDAEDKYFEDDSEENSLDFNAERKLDAEDKYFEDDSEDLSMDYEAGEELNGKNVNNEDAIQEKI
ncbi:DUF2052 domain-containing protein [Caerostris extrusa]|uniref:DUF2052 domain-containing protein n=1 Tax=Caerostris extrusa TaxID=172846 RepID=A0AAV4Q7T3_CAEEX|nr:DUF2052 domain-containing protein [Caerostris extrusa]